MIIIGIDQSKRSTAVTALNDLGELVDFMLVTPPSNYDAEMLVNHQWQAISSFISNMGALHGYNMAIALEGAAFAAGGSSSDLLWGIQWYIRTRIFVEFPGVPIGIITPATWRSKILPIASQREFKSQFGGKIGLKHGVVSVLPPVIRTAFEAYIEKHKGRILESKGLVSDGRSKKYKEGMFDLADSWGICMHRLSLVNKNLKVSDKSDKVKDKKLSVLKRRFPNAS